MQNNRYTINRRPKGKKPVKEYLRLQGRFRHLSEEAINKIQEMVDAEWEILLQKEGSSYVASVRGTET